MHGLRGSTVREETLERVYGSKKFTALTNLRKYKIYYLIKIITLISVSMIEKK